MKRESTVKRCGGCHRTRQRRHQYVTDDVDDDLLPTLLRAAADRCVEQVRAQGYEAVEAPVTRLDEDVTGAGWQDPDTGEWLAMPRRRISASVRCVRAVWVVSGE